MFYTSNIQTNNKLIENQSSVNYNCENVIDYFKKCDIMICISGSGKYEKKSRKDIDKGEISGTGKFALKINIETDYLNFNGAIPLFINEKELDSPLKLLFKTFGKLSLVKNNAFIFFNHVKKYSWNSFEFNPIHLSNVSNTSNYAKNPYLLTGLEKLPLNLVAGLLMRNVIDSAILDRTKKAEIGVIFGTKRTIDLLDYAVQTSTNFITREFFAMFGMIYNKAHLLECSYLLNPDKDKHDNINHHEYNITTVIEILALFKSMEYILNNYDSIKKYINLIVFADISRSLQKENLDNKTLVIKNQVKLGFTLILITILKFKFIYELFSGLIEITISSDVGKKIERNMEKPIKIKAVKLKTMES